MTSTTTFCFDTDDFTLTRLLGSLAKDPGNHDLMRVMADRLEELVSVSDEAAGLAMACRYAARMRGELAMNMLGSLGWHSKIGAVARYLPDEPCQHTLDAFRRLSIAMSRAGVTA